MRNDITKIKTTSIETVEQHYSPGDLISKFTLVLKNAGKDINTITIDELTPIDEFHLRGRDATEELLRQITLNENSRVLDVGCGIGGPCRLIASRYKCSITGIDLSAEFVRTAVELTRITGLQNFLDFQKADAAALPFENREFDMVLTQHVQMNIENKSTFVKEISRVLKSDGMFVFYDLFRAGTKPFHFPVPWAENEEISFLIDWDKYKRILDENGLVMLYEEDTTKAVKDWFRAMMERTSREGEFPLNIQLVMGGNAKEKMMNVRKSLEEGSIRPVQAVFKKL